MEPFADAPSGGSDDYIVYFIDKELDDETKVIVHDLYHNNGADISEDMELGGASAQVIE
jgi:hypothetical protein